MAATACSEPAARDADWPGSVDTLANVSNPAEPLWSDGEGWALVEEVRVGSADAEGPELFAQIRALEMDDQGRIYVLDGQANELRIFDPDGVHLRTVGGRARVPASSATPRAWDGTRMGSSGWSTLATPASPRSTRTDNS